MGCVWTGKFNLNTLRGQIIFLIREKKVADSKLSGYVWASPDFPNKKKWHHVHLFSKAVNYKLFAISLI